MEKKEDLRVRKTKRNIKKAFSELLQEKKLEKITVAEIARTAEINKGTFYLHYSDIYDLYQELIRDVVSDICSRFDSWQDFFFAPEIFFRKILAPRKKLPSQYQFIFQQNKQNRIVPRIFTHGMKEQLYAVGILAPSLENDMKLEMLISGCFLLILEYGKEEPETVISVISSQIRNSFGEIPVHRSSNN